MIIGKLKAADKWPGAGGKRRWKAKRDFGNQDGLAKHRKEKADISDGQSVKTFVSDEWTLEYDLALGPKDQSGHFANDLAKDVYVAACLAEEDEGNSDNTEKEAKAIQEFAALKENASASDGCSAAEVLASRVYAKFAKDGVSKAVTANAWRSA